MGAPKLLLPWRDALVIDAVLAAWQESQVAGLVVVVAAADEQLAAHCRQSGCAVVALPNRPADMKASVCAGLDELARLFGPSEQDAWLLAPADLPRLTSGDIDAVIECGRAHPGKIVAAESAGRRGHPVLFPWKLADEVTGLGSDQGVNQLLKGRTVISCECGGTGVLADIDTPEEYRRQVARDTGSEPDHSSPS